MDFNEIEKLITLLDKSSITSFDYDTGEYRLKITKGSCKENSCEEEPYRGNIIADPSSEDSITLLPKDITDDMFIVKSPLVGTFHTHEEDKAKPFVKVGDIVKKEQILCAIEAMKIFNTISSPIDGTVVEILHSDGDIVDFDKDLIILQKG